MKAAISTFVCLFVGHTKREKQGIGVLTNSLLFSNLFIVSIFFRASATTTADPLTYLSALAASIAALKARRFV